MSRISRHLLEQHEQGKHDFVVDGLLEDGRMPDIEIETGIKPKPRHAGRVLPLDKMGPGKSFFVKADDDSDESVDKLAATLRVRVNRYKLANGIRFSVHKETNDDGERGCRVYYRDKVKVVSQ